MEIDIEILIQEVEKRPIIYDTLSPSYHDRVKKKMLWEEIYKILSPKWSTYTKIEKITFGKLVQKKWHSLRDCFRRELIIRRNIACGMGGPKKAKYKYFDVLQYLKPFTLIRNIEPPVNNPSDKDSHVKDSDNDNDNDGSNQAQDEEEIEPDVNRTLKIELDDDTVTDPLEDEEITVQKDCPVASVMCKEPAPESNLRMIIEEVNDDKLFLLSLLPSFKNSSMEEKYLLRIEIMKTIMKFKQSRKDK